MLVFLKDPASSRLVETIIQLSHKPLLRELYKKHLTGSLVDLALHPIANFPIQRLTAASAKYKLVGDVFVSGRELERSLLVINLFSLPLVPEAV